MLLLGTYLYLPLCVAAYSILWSLRNIWNIYMPTKSVSRTIQKNKKGQNSKWITRYRVWAVENRSFIPGKTASRRSWPAQLREDAHFPPDYCTAKAKNPGIWCRVPAAFSYWSAELFKCFVSNFSGSGCYPFAKELKTEAIQYSLAVDQTQGMISAFINTQQVKFWHQVFSELGLIEMNSDPWGLKKVWLKSSNLLSIVSSVFLFVCS